MQTLLDDRQALLGIPQRSIFGSCKQSSCDLSSGSMRAQISSSLGFLQIRSPERVTSWPPSKNVFTLPYPSACRSPRIASVAHEDQECKVFIWLHSRFQASLDYGRHPPHPTPRLKKQTRGWSMTQPSRASLLLLGLTPRTHMTTHSHLQVQYQGLQQPSCGFLGHQTQTWGSDTDAGDKINKKQQQQQRSR